MLTIGQLCASCMFYCHEVPKGSLTDMPQFKPQEIPPMISSHFLIAAWPQECYYRTHVACTQCTVTIKPC